MSKKKKVYEPRLRTRGGPGVRDRWTRIVSRMKRDHKCPRCSCPSVKRDSVGIWSCEKCGYTFAGGAYTPKTKQGRAPIRVREYSRKPIFIHSSSKKQHILVRQRLRPMKS